MRHIAQYGGLRNMIFPLILFALIWSLCVTAAPSGARCKCTPGQECWPSATEWVALNSSLGDALIRGVPPGSVCFPEHENYDREACMFVTSQWHNSTWHATDPVSIDYPIWTNNSCIPILPNGMSLTGDVGAGERGCSIGAYPAYVVRATSAEQIATALVWAKEKNIRVIVKGTGHSYAGRSIGYGSLSIWTHHLRGLEYVEDFKPKDCPIESESIPAVRVAAGHTGIEIQTELAKYGQVTVTGGNPDVGAAGWLTGGGHGLLSTEHGMGADNLLEATIVTPDGKILLANPCQNTDIFFAIRGGGGGTYGVVTEMVTKTFPTPRTTSGDFLIITLSPETSTEFWELMGVLHAELQNMKDGGMVGYYVIAGAPYAGSMSFKLTYAMFDKPEGTLESLLKSITNYMDDRSDLFKYYTTSRTTDTYLESWGLWPNEPIALGGSAYGSRFMSPRSLSNASRTAEVFAEIGGTVNPLEPSGPVSNPVILGHFTATPYTPSYYADVISMNPAWRNTLVSMLVVEPWLDGSTQEVIDSVYKDITNHKVEALRKLSPETGAYFNEPDSYEPEWQSAFFGSNYERLKGIKEKLDPTNVMWCRRCVGSEALIEQADGRLCYPS